jgi:hypothetical protein
MRAILYDSTGPHGLRLGEAPDPQPREHEALVGSARHRAETPCRSIRMRELRLAVERGGLCSKRRCTGALFR